LERERKKPIARKIAPQKETKRGARERSEKRNKKQNAVVVVRDVDVDFSVRGRSRVVDFAKKTALFPVFSFPGVVENRNRCGRRGSPGAPPRREDYREREEIE
jgi:hypothetical protein